jgi:translation initiation factor 2 alpha subunit (eIF-2alpha)
MNTPIKEDDILMCTVTKIEGTTVFVDIEGGETGTIVFSEVAAGRIRNIRDYVSVGKKIVCKVLKMAKDHIELSLRRVTAKEKEEIKDKYEKERNLLSMLKASLKKPEEVFKKIMSEYEAPEFIEEARSNPAIVEKFIPKSEVPVFTKILAEKKEKEKIAKKNVSIKSYSPEGINDIKSALQTAESANNIEIHYLGSSKFSLSAKGKDFKQANHKVLTAIEQIKNKSKEKKFLFESDEK